eukprot:498884_1
MEDFKNADLDEYFEKAYGWAAFPQVGKFAFIIGVGGAGGEVFAHDEAGKVTKVGKATLMMASAGWSLGLTVFSEIIFFENEEAFKRFTSGTFEFEAGAKIHILKTGVDTAARTTGSGKTIGTTVSTAEKGYTNGMATFVRPKVGAMIDVSAEGQTFIYSADAAVGTVIIDCTN